MSSTPQRNVPLSLRSLVRELETQLGPCRRILEIGCGPDSALQYLAGTREIEGLDVHEPWLLKAKERGILTNYHLANALEIDTLFQPGQFDAIVALDLIEHLEKPDGYRLIEKMSAIASDRIIIFTPNGFLEQQDDSNPWNNHRSGWSVSDFVEQGFSVVGVNGWKKLRGSWARLRFRPRLFWGAVSELSQILLTRNHPRLAFSLLCTKRINRPAGKK